MKHLIIGGILLAGLAMPAAAQRIVNRQVHQQERIAQGRHSGQLTRGEAARLERRERALHRSIVRDRVDGRGLTARERAKIKNRQNALSRDIFRMRHNRRR